MDGDKDNVSADSRKAKIDFALEIAEKIIEKYPTLGDQIDIRDLICTFVALDSHAKKLSSD